MIATAMFGFASGAWAQEAGDDATAGGDEVLEVGTDEGATDDVVGGGEEIFETGVVDGEEVADGGEGEVIDPAEGASGEEILYMTGGVGEEVADGGEAIVDGEGVVTGFTDGDGNVIFFRSDSVDAAEEGEMVPLMMQSGASGSFITVADTTAEQGGIDSGVNLGIEVVDAGQSAFAGPIDVATTGAAVSAGGSAGGTATRISGGHLSTSSQQ